MKQTVFPKSGEGFPPASFWRLGDAMAFALQTAREQQTSAVGMCPARSFSTHWNDARAPR